MIPFKINFFSNDLHNLLQKLQALVSEFPQLEQNTEIEGVDSLIDTINPVTESNSELAQGGDEVEVELVVDVDTPLVADDITPLDEDIINTNQGTHATDGLEPSLVPSYVVPIEERLHALEASIAMLIVDVDRIKQNLLMAEQSANLGVAGNVTSITESRENIIKKLTQGGF